MIKLIKQIYRIYSKSTQRIVQVFFFFIYYYLVFHIILSTPTAQPHIITSEMSCYVYIW
jgi:hypothetical protein